jgi:hypothetical protein
MPLPLLGLGVAALKTGVGKAALSWGANKLFGGAKTQASGGQDAASQQYINQMRQMGIQNAQSAMNQPLVPGLQDIQANAAGFMNPYQSQVIDGMRGEFDFMRGQAMNMTNANATQAGAFGGSRHGVMAGARLGELDRAQGQQIGNMMHSGYQNAMQQGQQLSYAQAQEPMMRQNQAMSMMQQGMGPTGWNQQSTAPANVAGGLAGIGTIASALWKNRPQGGTGLPGPVAAGGMQGNFGTTSPSAMANITRGVQPINRR